MASQEQNAVALAAAAEITALVSNSGDSALTEADRARVLQAASRIVTSIEKPEDGILKFAYSPSIWMAIRCCVQLDVFAVISQQETISSREIAETCHCDEALIRRLLRVLTASGFVAEKGDGLYGATLWTKHMEKRLTKATIKFLFDQSMPSIAVAPEWFRQRAYQNPTDPMEGLFHAAFHTDMAVFPWFALPENKERWDDANTFFEGDRGSRASWVTWFPVKEKLLDGRDRDSTAPVLVDVAGGRGHDLMEFLDQFPEEPGPFVLQDQQPVLDSALGSLPDKVRTQAFDFFKEAPVGGARIYFMKFILHDYGDGQCLEILRNVKKSMVRGYSYLVINEFVLPDTGCSLLQAEWDLMMMVLLSSMERTESQWRSLLDDADLEVEGIYRPEGDGQGIIVAKLR
ncbi:S-adenosyl-L-methionine-dependent methyltransferase [Xylariaceae sp. FL0594]|nr:S-adenosyl-L-methionine-dependent methyltransferase [Xylariaceae sp. FL0594]